MWMPEDQTSLTNSLPLSAKFDFGEADTYFSFKKIVLTESNSWVKAVQESGILDPEDQNVTERLQFLTDPDYTPYRSAIEKLKNFSSYPTMSEKLHCLFVVMQEAVQCVKEFWKLVNPKKSVLVYE